MPKKPKIVRTSSSTSVSQTSSVSVTDGKGTMRKTRKVIIDGVTVLDEVIEKPVDDRKS